MSSSDSDEQKLEEIPLEKKIKLGRNVSFCSQENAEDKRKRHREYMREYRRKRKNAINADLMIKTNEEKPENQDDNCQKKQEVKVVLSKEADDKRQRHREYMRNYRQKKQEDLDPSKEDIENKRKQKREYMRAFRKKKEDTPKMPSENHKEKNRKRREYMLKYRQNQSTPSRTDIITKFKNIVSQMPVHPCSSCGKLCYESECSKFSKQELSAIGCSDEFQNKIVCIFKENIVFCQNCYRNIKKLNILPLCLSNGFGFPEIPDIIKDLSPLEERMVAPRIPFCQIRPGPVQQQSILVGNVVNVPSNLDETCKVLPRRFTEMDTVQVYLMRKLEYKQPYISETFLHIGVFF